MSIDEEFENNLLDIPLYSVLESRNECLNKSEVWAILKETCIALKPISNDVENKKIKLDINSLLIDGSGNVKVDLERSSAPTSACDDKSMMNDLGEMFKVILLNYSDVKENEDLFQFVDNMANATTCDQFSILNIEMYADRQLNGSSVDLLYQGYLNSKRSEDLSSAFQDSFLSTELSINTEDDTDSDQSICLTKEFDTFSTLSDDKPFNHGEDSKYFVCLNQLWSHSLDPLFRSDQEYLVFIFVILKEMSNILLNEDNFKRCTCITKENVFLNPLGQMLLNFSSSPCDLCVQEKMTIQCPDTRYINKVGTILYDVTQSDQRINVSNQIVLLLQRMRQCSDMTISEILDFCKTNSSIKILKCRSVLKCLFDRWNYWFNLHLNYLLNLKHKFLYEISTKNLRTKLKPTKTKSPFNVLQLFHHHPTWLTGLKYVTKLSKPHLPPYSTNSDAVSSHCQSAFRPYNTNKSYVLPSKAPISSRIKDDTHFHPLVFTSESSSVYRSQDSMLSPVGVPPKYSDIVRRRAVIPPSPPRAWRSKNHVSLNDIHQSSVPQQNVTHPTKNSNDSNEIYCSLGRPTSKINLVIEVIQSVLSKSYTSENEEIADRHLLSIADFALPLGRLSLSIFCEAMKQRFDEIRWTEDSLYQLYDVISTKDVDTPSNDSKCKGNSSEGSKNSKDFIFSRNQNDVVDHGNFGAGQSQLDTRSKSSSATSEDSESFEDIERQCASVVVNEEDAIELSQIHIESTQRNLKEDEPNERDIKVITSPMLEGSSDISDYPRRKVPPVLPNKLQSKFNPHLLEDSSFYQQICPATLSYFHSTLQYLNQSTVTGNEQIVTSNKVQELLQNFQDLNKTIRFKFKELSKTVDLISKCDESNKSDKKVKKGFINDHMELQSYIESLVLNEMKLETSIVEFHSVNLDEIKSGLLDHPVVFSNDIKHFQNLQFIHPSSLVMCLFARGAVSAGLIYDFFLVYREFYKPVDFIQHLALSFKKIEHKLQNGSLLITKARFRLLYILLCWVEGFYNIDISSQILSMIKDIAISNLVPFIKDTQQLIENTLTNARSIKGTLPMKLTALSRRKELVPDIIHDLDIQHFVLAVDKNAKDKGRLYLRSSLNFNKGVSLGNQDTFSILNISPKDLAVCLTLIQQVSFNSIHPCHLLLYLRSLTDNDESILNSINNDRFPARRILHNDGSHKEIRTYLLLSGQITHWATSEILLTTDIKLQAKIVKKLVLTCNWCVDLNNYASMSSISEALSSDKLKWAPFWTHVTTKIVKSLKDINTLSSKLSNNTSNWPDETETSPKRLLSGAVCLPCLPALLVHLKMSSFGKCVTREGCLKWTKLRKISKIIDQIRIYQQFGYISNDRNTNELKSKLKYRIEHLTSISLDILQSHNMLTQTS